MISFILFLTLFVSGLLEIFVPFVVGIWIWSRTKASWVAFLVGAVLWIVALEARIPINSYGTIWVYTNFSGAALVYLGIALPSLTAGIFEEGARWLAFRFLVKDHRLENGLMYGAGHGGIESILLVGLTVLNSAIAGYFLPQTLTAAQLASLSATPEWAPFIGLWERLFTIIFHIAMSVLVLESFRQKQTYYLFVAMGAHFFLNFTAIYALQWGIFQSETIVTLWGIASFYYIWTTWRSYKAAASEAHVAQVPEAPAPPTTV